MRFVFGSIVLLLSSSLACSSPPPGPGSSVRGLALMPALAGLWTGPATQTLLGDFPMMNVDFRAATEGMLFGRVDLDGENSLRLAFDVETIDGADVLVFRNGGLFSGMTRDTRNVLVDSDEAAGIYHFCAREAEGGCGYVDAVWTFDAATHVVLDVHVRGAPHLHWDARRAEARTVPLPFPASDAPQGSGTEPFPDMPALAVTVSWSTPLAAPADVWLILATTPCVSGTCVPSRWFRVGVDAGATSATMMLDQIHADSYRGTAVLDRNGDVATTLRPGPGDGVSIPDATIEIASTGTSSRSLSIVVDL
jgi:hypothetical protein